MLHAVLQIEETGAPEENLWWLVLSNANNYSHNRSVVKLSDNCIYCRFSTWRICSREQRKKQLDWLVTNTDDITTQSHSLFACSREQIRLAENRLYLHRCCCCLRYSQIRNFRLSNETRPQERYNDFVPEINTRVRPITRKPS